MTSSAAKSAWTAGPWIAINDGDKRSDGYIREAAPYDEAGRRLSVAKVTSTGRGYQETQANMALIAAAPTMAAALDLALEALTYSEPVAKQYSEARERHFNAIAAVGKAIATIRGDA